MQVLFLATSYLLQDSGRLITRNGFQCDGLFIIKGKKLMYNIYLDIFVLKSCLYSLKNFNFFELNVIH